jgi:outer membrane immunogenic protein
MSQALKSATAWVFASLCVAGSPVQASDVIGPSPFQPLTPPFPWTGVYLGSNVGGAFASGVATTAGGAGSTNLSGVTGGGQIGANFQSGPAVFGVELDFQGSTQSATSTNPVDPLGLITATETDAVPWFGTARLRVGAAIPGGWLPYFTVGGGWIDFKSDLSASGFGMTVANPTWEVSHIAWTVGAGIEYALTRNWSFKSEYLYLDSGTFSTNVNLFGLAIVPVNVHLKQNIGRIGVNYRF